MQRGDRLAFTLHVMCGGGHVDLTECDDVTVTIGDAGAPCVAVGARGLRVKRDGVRVRLTREQTAALPCGASAVELRARRGPIVLIAGMEPLIVGEAGG